MLLSLCGGLLTACAGAAPDTGPEVLETREGLASFYGKAFHGEETASGDTFDMHALVAAHPTYPFGTRVRVTNLENDRATEVRVVDRGPAGGPRQAGVIVDLSRGVARELQFLEDGLVRVRLEVLEWGEAE